MSDVRIDLLAWSQAQRMTLKACKDIVGGIGSPSKMPCLSYGLPAKECNTGSKLRKIKGSVCAICLALKGRYVFKNVQNAQYRRFGTLDHPLWPYAMARLVAHYSRTSKVWRWHDSGDLRDMGHLENVARVALLTPDVRHWIPTKEVTLVTKFRAKYGEDFCPNLNLRLSGFMIGGAVPTYRNIPNVTASIVHPQDVEGVYNCPARHQGNYCGDCRACWDRSVPVVNYHQH